MAEWQSGSGTLAAGEGRGENEIWVSYYGRQISLVSR